MTLSIESWAVLRIALLISLAGALQCTGFSPGIEVGLQYETGDAEFVTDGGEHVVLHEALLSISSAELVLCDDGVALSFAPAKARAHGEVESEGGMVLDAMGDGSTIVQGGVLYPRPGRYCALRLHFEPEYSSESHTIVLVGTADDEPFVLFSDETTDMEFTFETALALDGQSNFEAIISLDPSGWIIGSGAERAAFPFREGFELRLQRSP